MRLHLTSLLASLLLPAVSIPPAFAAEAKRPNVIFIIADDMFRDMFNCTPEGRGRNVTPTLDRLAAEGVVMQGQHIVSPVCTPSRFNCLTGRYASRARNAAFTQMTERGGMSLVVWNTMLLADDVTLPRLMQKAGYTTGTVGKHHCVGWPKLEPMSPAEDARAPAVAAKLQANGRQMEAALRALGFDFATNIISGNLDERYPQNAGVHNLDWLVSGALDFIDRNKENWKYIALRYPPNPETIVDLRKPEGGRGTQRPDPASPADLKPRPPFGHIGGNNNEDRPKKTYPAYWDADQLYDLSADPKEQRNLAKDPTHTTKLEELKRELRRHLEKLPGGFAELKPAR